MTTSVSTPRLRITQTWYLALLLLAGVSAGWPSSALADQLCGSLALLLVVGGSLGRIWCSAFIAGRKDETLVSNGPYSRCRHPLYSLSWIVGAGLGLATRSLTLTALTLVILALLFWRATVAEEQFLELAHGESFRRYRAATPRFVPRAASEIWPAAIDVIPAIFRKSFRDATAMLLLLLLIDTAHRLRLAGVLPTWLALP